MHSIIRSMSLSSTGALLMIPVMPGIMFIILGGDRKIIFGRTISVEAGHFIGHGTQNGPRHGADIALIASQQYSHGIFDSSRLRTELSRLTDQLFKVSGARW